MRELLLRQIEALKAQALLLASSADALLALAEQMLPGAPPPEEVEGACVHPAAYRMPCAASGRPNRFVCRRCGKEINP